MAKRYIEANALIQDIEQSKANNNHNNSIAYQTHNAEHKKFIKMVLEQPTADVVEVVRCKECKHCELRYPAKAIGEEAIEGYYCYPNQRYVKSTDFCNYGERSEGDG